MGHSKSKLTLCTDELDFLERNTSLGRAEIKRWYKEFQRTCPGGRLGRDQFLALYDKFNLNVNTKEYCEHVFRTFDRDKNNTIEFSEFLLAINVMGNGTVEEKLMWSFKMFDIDDNGSIDRNEMKKIIKSIYGMLGPNASSMIDISPETKAMGIFDRLDRNKNDKITRQEFVQGCLKDTRQFSIFYYFKKIWK